MPDVWLPGATRDPGVNANYRLGRCSMRRMIAHGTVGSDSRGVGKRGYFNLLVHRSADRENGCTQYAEIDSITWHSFPPDRLFAPGVEFERRVIGGLNAEGLSIFEDLTPNQIEWGKRIVDFCYQHGIEPNLYHGPRYHHGNFNGWVNHKDIDPSRSDGLTRAEWDLLKPSIAIPDENPEGGLMWNVFYQNLDGTVSFVHGIGSVVAFKVVGKPDPVFGVPSAELDYIGFNANGIPTRLVTPSVGFRLEKVSRWLTENSKDLAPL